MNIKFATAAILVGALALPVLGHTADDKDMNRSSAKTWVKDSVITTKIKAEMVKDPVVSAMHITVDTDDKGVVQLSGTAKSQNEVDKAIQIAQNTKGVTTVQNQIKISKDR